MAGELGPGSWDRGDELISGTGDRGPGTGDRGPVVTVHAPQLAAILPAQRRDILPGHDAHRSGACAFGARDTAHGRAAFTGYNISPANYQDHDSPGIVRPLCDAHKKARTFGGLCDSTLSCYVICPQCSGIRTARPFTVTDAARPNCRLASKTATSGCPLAPTTHAVIGA